MAIIHPPLPDIKLINAGAYRERDILQQLQSGLPDTFDAYHSVQWSSLHEETQRFGEIDIVVLTPQGHLVLLEVKAGDVSISEHGITKQYSSDASNPKNINHQIHAQVNAMRQALHNNQLDEVRFAHLLVLPDQKITLGSIAYPRERIVDATQLDQLCQLIVNSVPTNATSGQLRERVTLFLENRFELIPDPSVHISQIQSTNSRLSEGLRQHYRNDTKKNIETVYISYADEHIRFESRYTQEGQSLIVKRTLTVDYPTRVCTPDDHDQYVKAVQVLRMDQRAQVMFQ